MKIYQTRRDLMAVMPPGGVCAEIGVFQGHFAQVIWEVCQPAKLHLIDPWRAVGAVGSTWLTDESLRLALREVQEHFAEQIKQGQVVLHQGLSDAVLAGLPADSLDWVYIDADHSYEGVWLDLLSAERCVRPGGLMAGHDYCLLEEAAKIRSFAIGVAPAVRDFCDFRGWELIARTQVNPVEEAAASVDADGDNCPSFLLARKGQC